MIVLGIESSCDETAAAVVAEGREILSSVVASQVADHAPYGGVVPELASRRHVEAIGPVVTQALAEAEEKGAAVTAVAATQGPGLKGALLVGFSFAKAWAYAGNLPFVGVNHLEGHVHSVLLSDNPPPFPFIALVASGGHTAIYKVASPFSMELLGRTLDDAAGEAFDKVSKAMGLGYPGGKVISDFAAKGDPRKIPFPRSWLAPDSLDFSFSGIKTAASRYIQDHPETWAADAPHIAAGFQEAVVEVLAKKSFAAAAKHSIPRLAIAGGVAANTRLRQACAKLGREQGVEVFIPPISLCGDNAAMIAAAGFHRLAQGERTPLTADVFPN
ncbi:MAG: tRNA (adenosine(37)-N6)-threonylcarbamoyltransferase complex transferase subunit TsaD [Deltaproteobacteria bacterium]|nr:tRNA (adenosine(37)-N6)-threonylcarbamoyltransferase complex transferase subunit TsaD [Deltaproteobacteria bacterium]